MVILGGGGGFYGRGTPEGAGLVVAGLFIGSKLDVGNQGLTN